MNKIIQLRRKGEPISHIFREVSKDNPYLDEMIQLNEIIIKCNERGIPFTYNEIIRFFEKIYNKEYHGDKKECKEFLLKYLSKNKVDPSKKNTFYNVDFKKRGSTIKDFPSNNEIYLRTTNSQKKTENFKINCKEVKDGR